MLPGPLHSVASLSVLTQACRELLVRCNNTMFSMEVMAKPRALISRHTHAPRLYSACPAA